MWPDWLAIGFMKFLLFWAFILWLITRRLGMVAAKFDSNGAIKGAAQKAAAKGVSNMIGRFLR
ncbi:hypothetical protein P12x_005342 [Tundrisphaera lichenicola]|uniref:hypothetical protein n=1 Tax=Tundrisphaera lichenicola TaxID=2029860 RepID=UPI003EB7F20F